MHTHMRHATCACTYTRTCTYTACCTCTACTCTACICTCTRTCTARTRTCTRMHDVLAAQRSRCIACMVRMHIYICICICIYADVSRSGLVACLFTTADDLTTAEPTRHQVRPRSARAAAEEHYTAAQRHPPTPLSGDGRPRTLDRRGRGPHAAKAGALCAPRPMEAADCRASQAGGSRWMDGCMGGWVGAELWSVAL